jgi:hypothetical protein
VNERHPLQPDRKSVDTRSDSLASVRISKIARAGRPRVNAEHTCWYDETTLLVVATPGP